MKKIIFPVLAVLTIVAAPAAYAKSMSASEFGAWYVLADANNRVCFAADRSATSGEQKLKGPFASQSAALSAIGSTAECAIPNNSD